ncbi:hypothetical protein C3L33_03159, partial [Rhododendron williamsianum]
MCMISSLPLSKAFVKAAESLGFAHQGSLGPTKGEAYRDNDRVSVNDPVLANTIWVSGLNKLFSDFKIRGKVAVGLNPNIRFYWLVGYKVGQHFGWHIDESVDLGDGKHTNYTLLIYLSGGMAFNDGMALLLIHGDKCMLHEARNVSKGVKYVLRSDVTFA